MPRRRYPLHAATVHIYSTPLGFRYTARDTDGKIVYESKMRFRSRWEAKKQIHDRWPKAEVTFGRA